MHLEKIEQDQVQCVICNKEIEEMVCERCRSRDITAWFQDNNFPHRMQTLFFQRLRQRMPRLTGEGYCARCSNERSTICGECFFRIAASSFKELSRSRLRNNAFEQTFRIGVYSPI